MGPLTMRSLLLLSDFILILQAACQTTSVVSTTSGLLYGTELDGVISFKGVRFGEAPTGQLRWAPPVPFVSNQTQNATVLPPSCLQQFPFATSAFTQFLFNDPPPASENEDCLFLNVWAPSANNTTEKKPVLFWIFGGGFTFGTGSLLEYDGTSLAANQDIVVVTVNYRTNIFGFPSSADLPIAQNNLGLLDQELALEWVQSNIAQFGGDPDKVTIMGQSAGAVSVGLAIVRDVLNTPFRAGIMLSGAPTSTLPTPDYSSFGAFATAMGCSQPPGAARLHCLKQVPASTIQNFTNGPRSHSFGRPVVDNVTLFADPLERIRSNATAQVPIILGNLENDGTSFTVGMTNLTAFLEGLIPGKSISSDLVRTLYPGQNDSFVIAEADRDFQFRCPDELWSAALTGAGVSSVFRYTYGAVFANLEKFPGAGAWHSSELEPLFGTVNRSTATLAEVTWSSTFQTAIANFVKDPNTSPAINWPKYIPGPPAKTFAKLAYNGNVEPDNFVDPVASASLDGPCNALWDKFLNFTA
ncbi:carboxylesterase [Mycena maculata]|uniref:Carboxylic ester hydrolase n=1 Tax=Mycena maculata TaxID=230809 RepID=A0AAD7MXM7_9AGAR|nr:carboxylesterase [Mycena maculata]